MMRLERLKTGLPAAGAVVLLVLAACSGSKPPAQAQSAGAPYVLDRTHLPIAEPPRPVVTELDVRNATPPPLFEVKAPPGAPNVLLVLIDDLGFAGTSTFGGAVPTPTFDKVAAGGLVYNNFHTTAVCSPTRTALLNGRNHHVNNMAGIVEQGTAFPGATARVPNDVAPLAETLRLNGYSTAAFGKWHQTAPWEVSVSGPTDRWPTRQGFDKFYGFIGGETNQWAPFIYDGVKPVEPPDVPGYHFLTDMTDQTVAWIRFQKALTPDRPFFVYFAPGAVHAPHHVPEEWIAKQKGQFDQGWDTLREQILARQIEKGIVPPGTPLAPRPDAIPAWDTLSADRKRLYTHQIETFAGYVAMTDHEIGRVVDSIQETGQLDNTLVVFVYGDNGTSGEGAMNGMFSEMTYFNLVQETVPDMLENLDKWGGPESYPHMSAGWAVAFDTPYTWMKQIASDFGGTKVCFAVQWPARIKPDGKLRSQFHHVVDFAPTVLELAGLPQPTSVNGVPQRPMDGISMAYTIDDPGAQGRHTKQYFEMFGNRAMYADGWLARTIHKAPWEPKPRAALTEDKWELYDTTRDFSLANDLAAQDPAKLAELQDLFMVEASRNQVLPIDDRAVERMNAALAGRPDLMAGRTSLTLGEGMQGMSENVFINIKNRSKTITAEVEVPKGAANGVVIAQGGRFGGWALYVKDGKPAYDYNFLGIERTTIASRRPLLPGEATIRFEFTYEGGGMGKGGQGALFVNGEKVAEGTIKRTQPLIFSADETADVGIDLATTVSPVFRSSAASRFTGRVEKVTVEVSD